MYDEKYFLYNYDDEHPEIVIPPNVTDDVDNDWLITASRKDDLLTEYQITVAEALAALNPVPAQTGKK